MGRAVPEAAGVGADLVGEDDRAVGESAELQLEVHEIDVHGLEKRLEHVVDLERHGLDRVDLGRRGELQRQRVVGVHQRIAQIVVFIAELDGGLLEDDALLDAEALGEAAGGDVADDDLERDDADLLHGGLAVTQLLDEVRRDALFLQQLHEVVRDLVVHNALAHDGAALEAVERGGVVLVGDDDAFRIVGRKDLLGLAFVKLFKFLHGSNFLS